MPNRTLPPKRAMIASQESAKALNEAKSAFDKLSSIFTAGYFDLTGIAV